MALAETKTESHLTVSFLSELGPAGECDFTLQEFIPLVRQVTRDLASREGFVERLRDYSAWIVPRYSGELREQEYTWAPSTAGVPGENGVPLRIVVEDQPAPIVSYNDELQAYFDSGSSSLCLECPERDRCPGAGLVFFAQDSGDWIRLLDDASNVGRQVQFFTLQIHSADGILLFEKDFLPDVLHAFVEFAGRMLNVSSSPSRQGAGPIMLRGSIWSRSGPAAPPAFLVTRRRIRLNLRANSAADLQTERSFIDWTAVETPAPAIVIDADDMAIRGSAHLAAAPPLHAFASDWKIVVNAEAMEILRHRIESTPTAELGFLAGSPAVDQTGKHFLLIARFLPLVSCQAAGSLTFNPLGDSIMGMEFVSGLLTRYASFIVGWYRLDSDNYHPDSRARRRETFLPQEIALHKLAFSQPWHVAFAGSMYVDTANFFRLEGASMIRIPFEVMATVRRG